MWNDMDQATQVRSGRRSASQLFCPNYSLRTSADLSEIDNDAAEDTLYVPTTEQLSDEMTFGWGAEIASDAQDTPRAAAQELSDEMTSDPHEFASDAETMDDDLPVMSADTLLRGLELPLFHQEEAREAVIDYAGCQVQRLKQRAQLAHDEFRTSLVITYNLRLKAEHLRQDYFDSVAASTYFQLAFDEYNLHKSHNVPDDKIAVKRPHGDRVRMYESEVPSAIRQLPDAQTFFAKQKSEENFRGECRLIPTLDEVSHCYVFQGQWGALKPAALAETSTSSA
ncbi:hypothetical protein HWV62_11624 [Athelia sp. TMB]|nr:hypothetical protein HWV62_11624 [Athelia sp. TMB]